MNPSRELDALVAEKVMGLKDVAIACPKCGSTDLGVHLVGAECCLSCNFNLNFNSKYSIPKFYSVDIAAAWEVVEKMLSSNGFEFALESRTKIRFGANFVHYYPSGEVRAVNVEEADTAPHAISLAALKACGIEVDK